MRSSAAPPAPSLPEGLDGLFTAPRDAGHTAVGPTLRDGAITLAELGSAARPPYGRGTRAREGGARR